MIQKTERTDTEKQKTEKQSFTKDLYRLKNAWERLQKAQAETLSRFRKSKTVGQISSVRIVTDMSGKKTVQVSLVGGGKIMDIGDKRAVFQKMMPKKNVNMGRIISLLDAVRQYGFAAVAMGLSPAMKALLLKACKNCGVPLQVKQQKSSYNMVKSTSPQILADLSGRNNRYKQPEEENLFSVDSVRSLQDTIQRQKKENDDRLRYVLQRAQERAKEKYFDRLRTSLIEIEQLQKNGSSLTEEQIKVKQLAERFGLKSDKSKETITDQQRKERQSMPLRELPKDIQDELKNEKRRYRAIRTSKNKAADLVYTMHTQDFEKGRSLKLSAAELAREATAYLPPPDQRNVQNLTSSIENIKNQTVQKKEELNKIKKEKQNRAAALMAQTMSATSPTRTQLQQQIKSMESSRTVHRKSFMSNAVMQELINRRQAER